MKKDIKIEKTTMSLDEINQHPAIERNNKNLSLLQDFIDLNNITPIECLTLFSNVLIWICEDHFNKQVFDALLERLKGRYRANKGTKFI